jgi:hypothetical protein
MLIRIVLQRIRLHAAQEPLQDVPGRSPVFSLPVSNHSPKFSLMVIADKSADLNSRKWSSLMP